MKPQHNNLHFLEGGGEMGELTRTKDWSKTAIGDPENWPQSLRTTLNILLNSKFPMFLFWGPELICFYNDAYRPSLGNTGKHPNILGGRAEEYWKEIWSVIKPLIDQVLSGRESSWSEDQLIPIYRNGKIEDVYWTFSYSPVNDESGKPVGVFVTCCETTDKIIIQQKLQESNEQLHFAIDSAELGTWDYNPATNKFISNERLKEWFGLPPETEIELHHAINIIAEKDRQRIADAIQRTLDYSSGGNFDGEFSIVNPHTQKEIILHGKGKAWFNHEKMAYRFTGILQDVTHHVLIRREIEESEQRFRTMAESSEILIATSDETGSATYFNKSWVELTGRPLENLLEFGWFDIVHPEDKERYVNICLNAFEKRESFTGEFRVLNKNGEYRWLLAKGPPRFRSDGTFQGYISSCIDITELKQAEEDLKESEKRLNIVIDASKLGTWELNIKTGEVKYSKMYLEILGGYQQDIKLTHVELLQHLHPDDFSTREKAFKEAFATGYLQYEGRLIWLDQSVHWMEGRGKVFYDAEHKPERLIGTIRDITEQKKYQQKLEESEQRFREVADQAPVLIWMSGTDKLCYFFNKAWLNFTGRTLKQEFGNGWADGVHPDDFQRCIDIYNGSFDKRAGFYLEYRLKRYDGEYRWISDKGVPRFTSDGAFEGYIGACMDIHDQRIYQKKREDAETRLRLATEVTGLATWDIDLDTMSIIYSPRLAEIFGHDRSAVITHAQMRNQIHRDDVNEIVIKAFDAAIKTGVYRYEARMVKPDNTVRWIRTQGKVFYNEDKKPVKLIGTTRDITEEKFQEQELLESEQKFRLLADSMPQHIWTADMEGNLNYYNQSVYNYSGLTPAQINKDGWLQIVHPEDREDNIRFWVEAITTGKNFLFEHRFRKHNGEYRWQLSRAIPQRDASGKIQMWVGTSTDIHDQKTFVNDLEKQVRERTSQLEGKNSELEKMNKELEAFAYISSHDLQEPLRKIQTFSSRIMEKEYENLSENGKDNFQRMQYAAQRMQTLIEDLLAYSRTTTAERKFEKTELVKIVEDVKEDLKEELQAKNATIELIDLCDVHIIPFQFRQLMYNFISNSLKFSNSHEAPHIKITCKVDKGIKFNIDKLAPELTYCHIRVSDNGIGFEQQYSEKIFKVFQRVHSKGQYAGTGIGLAIVKKIVDNHNGIIVAKGEINVGATFDIYIPAG